MTTEIRHSHVLYRKGNVSLVREEATLPGGSAMETIVIRHPGASAILPFLDSTTIVLIRQYRHAIGDYLWEIPAGTINDGEAALECAQRELTEETGYTAARWDEMGHIIPAPGVSDERIHLYAAHQLSPAQQRLDCDEIIDVQQVSFDRALEMVRKGLIVDAKSLCALMLFRPD